MRVDSEEQRSMIIRLIDNMPMTGVLSEMNKLCVELIDLRQAAQAAKIDVPKTGGNITELPKK